MDACMNRQKTGSLYGAMPEAGATKTTFLEGYVIQGSKQEATKVVSLCKNGSKT